MRERMQALGKQYQRIVEGEWQSYAAFRAEMLEIIEALGPEQSMMLGRIREIVLECPDARALQQRLDTERIESSRSWQQALTGDPEALEHYTMFRLGEGRLVRLGRSNPKGELRLLGGHQQPATLAFISDSAVSLPVLELGTIHDLKRFEFKPGLCKRIEWDDAHGQTTIFKYGLFRSLPREMEAAVMTIDYERRRANQSEP